MQKHASLFSDFRALLFSKKHAYLLSGNKTEGMDTFRKQYSPDNVYLVAKSGIPWEEFLEVEAADLL